VAVPSFFADEMLGRLARYLRFVGCDTLYLRGATDEELLRRARAEHRVVLTRDRALARRATDALLIGSPHLPAQWAAVRARWPALPHAPSFERCTLCNGPLTVYALGTDPEREGGLPKDRAAAGLAIWRCRECGHLYWEGSHTARVREQLARWEGGESR